MGQHEHDATDATWMAPGDQAPPGVEGSGDDLCRRCGGTGRLEGEECPACAGTGRVVEGIGGG